MQNNSILVISTFIMFSSMFVFLMNRHINKYQIGLGILLFINVILSFMLWMNPIHKSVIHKIDGFFAKLSIVLFTIYIAFFSKIDRLLKYVFFLMLSSALIMSYFSNYYSCLEWNSFEHIISHCGFHMFISMGLVFAFVDETIFTQLTR